ncbi:hypothetical protein R6Q59_020764 [Mikania micrantha]
MASSMWQVVSQWCKIPPIYAFEFHDLITIYRFFPVSRSKKEIVQAIIITACWCLWRMRNEMVFNGKQPSLQKLIEDVKS